MITVEALTKYYGPTRALADVSFQIETGQIIGLLGLNGAGKSTVLKILAGFLLPTSGSVYVGGVDVVAEPEKVRARIGFLPEVPPLYDEMTVTGFLSYLARLRGVEGGALRARLPEVLASTGLTDRAGATISTLSLGYRKRLGIAQAIIHDPALVILDEPISGLDPVQIVQMRELVRSLRGRHTVLVSSHILPEVHQTCDRLLMLREGRLVAQGTEAELEAGAATGRRLLLTLKAGAEGALTALKAHPATEGATVLREGGGVVTVELVLRSDEIEDICARLVGAGIGLRRVVSAENELESAFLAMAGGEGRP